MSAPQCSRCGRADREVAYSVRLDADVCLWCYRPGAPRSKVSEDDLEFAREARQDGRDLEALTNCAAVFGRQLRAIALDLELAAGSPAALRAEAGRTRARALEALRVAA